SWLTWTLVRDRLPELLRLPLMPVSSGAMAAGGLVKDAMQRASYVLVGLGAVMLVRERSRYSKRLRMSKQEIRRITRWRCNMSRVRWQLRRLLAKARTIWRRGYGRRRFRIRFRSSKIRR